MSRPLKKSIKNNGMIKVKRSVRKFRNKSGRVFVYCKELVVFLLMFFFVLLLGFFIGIAANSTIIPDYPSLAQTRTALHIPVFCFGHNDFYDQNILYCRLLGLIIF